MWKILSFAFNMYMTSKKFPHIFFINVLVAKYEINGCQYWYWILNIDFRKVHIFKKNVKWPLQNALWHTQMMSNTLSFNSVLFLMIFKREKFECQHQIFKTNIEYSLSKSTYSWKFRKVTLTKYTLAHSNDI